MMDWIIYAMNEIALIFNPDAVRMVKPLMTRIRYGVKEELSALVSFRGVGRSRARILFNKGIRTRDDVLAIPEQDLAAISGIGPALARSLKDQTGGYSEPQERSSPSEEEEAMLDALAMEYGQMPLPAVEDNQDRKKKKGAGEAGPKQSSLFDF
jgi:helicase